MMPTNITKTKSAVNRRQFGQTLIIALIVTTTLVLLGFVFVTIIGRNFFTTQRYGEVIDVQYYAEAGINFAQRQLVYSEDGADWRPEPETINGVAWRDGDPIPSGATQADIDRFLADPDYHYIKRYDPSDNMGGYTRINFNQGRALIRVTWEPIVKISTIPNTTNNPHNAPPDPSSRFIKIESVGKIGKYDPSDPTTGNDPTLASNKTRKTLIAYVQIGITDYVRWVTNLGNKSMPAELGCPNELGINYIMPNGNAIDVHVKQYVGYPEGASVRVNGDLKLYGDTDFLMRSENNNSFLVDGNIEYGENNVKGNVDNLTDKPINSIPQTNTDLFNENGLIRAVGQVARLEPPVLDIADPSTQQNRYLMMTRGSGMNYNGVDMGPLGYGRGVFVNNFGDSQDDSTDISGGYSKRSDWLRSNSDLRSSNYSPDKIGGYWNGPFYEPPGAMLQFFYEPRELDNSKKSGFTIVRNNKFRDDVWYDLSGNPTTNHSLTYWFRDGSNASNKTIYNQFTEQLSSEMIGNIPFNGVIYFAGNVRVRGRIPADRQITVVCNGTIYIEGNIVKGSPKSTLALLARDYVVVNTTQFFRPSIENTPRWVKENPSDPMEIPHARVTSDPMSSVVIRFSLGSLLPANTERWLFLSHAGTGLGTYINMLMNVDAAGNPIYYQFPKNSSLNFHFPTQPLVPVLALDMAQDMFPSFQRFVLPLDSASGAQNALIYEPGVENMFAFQLDSQLNSPAGKQPYFHSKMAVLPLDIEINALIYAQNGSFFVIPGLWFNENPEDRKDVVLNALSGSTNYDDVRDYRRRQFGVLAPDNGPDYPYYGEPVPIRITINGAISENFTAGMSDQMEWMKKWGWIPSDMGFSGIKVPNAFLDVGPTLTVMGPIIPNIIIKYDPTLMTGCTYVSGSTITERIRTDYYGRLLPPMPRLPVCPKLVYVGEAVE